MSGLKPRPAVIVRGGLAVVAAALAGALVLAEQRPRYAAHADLVVVHALAETRRGSPVTGLEREHFRVFEDGRAQEISLFSALDAPATIGLLIDNSTSMISRREQVISAAAEFARLSNPADEIFVLAFNEDVREVWKPRIIADSGVGDLQRTLLTGIVARGMTALFDAINAGLDRMATAQHTRQVLVVISDGSDTASNAPLARTMARVGASSAMIYTVMLHDPADYEGKPRLLRQLSRDTGGEAFAPRQNNDIPRVLADIARDIRSTYTLGFAPHNQARDGSVRKLQVTARQPNGRSLRVRARTAYLAPGASGGTQ